MHGSTGDDLKRAAVLARHMAGDLAIAEPRTDESLMVALPAADGDRSAQDIETAARRLVRTAFERAMDMLISHRDLLENGAAMLLEHEALEREDLAALFGPRPGISLSFSVSESA